MFLRTRPPPSRIRRYIIPFSCLSFPSEISVFRSIFTRLSILNTQFTCLPTLKIEFTNSSIQVFLLHFLSFSSISCEWTFLPSQVTLFFLVLLLHLSTLRRCLHDDLSPRQRLHLHRARIVWHLRLCISRTARHGYQHPCVLPYRRY